MRASIHLDEKTEMLMKHIRGREEGMSAFVQRLIHQQAALQGLEVVTIVRERRKK